MSGIFKPPVDAQLNRDHPLAQGLVGCWLFNEMSGNKAHDYSGQGNTGTLTNMADPPTSTSGFGPGPHGGALAFDGNNDYVDISPIWGMFPANNTAFTIMSCFRVFGTGQMEIVEIGRGQTGVIKGFRLVTLTNALYGQIMNGTTRYSVTGGSIAVGADCYGALTYNGVTSCLYVNGVLVDSKSTGTWVKDTLAYIGKQDDNTSFLNGSSSFVSIYNRALSANEIAFLYSFPYAMFEKPPSPWMERFFDYPIITTQTQLQ